VLLEPRGQVRRDIRRTNRLVEPHQHDDGAIDAAAAPVPVRLQQVHRRRREGERVRSRQAPAADRLRGDVDGDLITRRIRQWPLRVRREDKDRGAGPPERAGHGGRDPEERRGDGRWYPAQFDHRFRKDDTYLVGLGAAADLAGRARADDAQGRGRGRDLGGGKRARERRRE
jgi:hypothetical protein